jgi:hypothetical protein
LPHIYLPQLRKHKLKPKKTMPKFKITTSMSSVNYDYYEVEALTEEEAINLIMSGEADAYDSEVETDANSLEIVDVIESKK